MKDIIWTLIVIWLIYKIVEVFRKGSKKSFTHSETRENRDRTTGPEDTIKEKNIRSAVNKHLNNEGEYVDFEELK